MATLIVTQTETAWYDANLCPACEEKPGSWVDGLCQGCRSDWDNHTIEEYERTEEDAWHDLQESLAG